MLKPDTRGIIEGVKFINGDTACAEGAICGGCRFAAGYPITPSTEIVEHLARRFPTVGGLFVQMEDEIASSITVVGAAWGGARAMTVTSGPGMSLMMEHIGYAAMTETPCVFVNVQRGGPSTGLPTLPAQQDVMQAKWGSHGDYQVIVLAASSPQEAFDLTIRAFNLSEVFRTPVILLFDEAVGHMLERVVIPPLKDIEMQERKFTKERPEGYRPYERTEDGVPYMAPIGKGYGFHITGLTHDERGYPVMSAAVQRELLTRLREKITSRAGEIIDFDVTDGEYPVLVMSYGITSRIAARAVEEAGRLGIKAGHMHMRTLWPFPEEALKNVLVEHGAKAVVFPELNLGQLVYEAERVAACHAKVYGVPNPGGAVHEPDEIVKVIERAHKEIR